MVTTTEKGVDKTKNLFLQKNFNTSTQPYDKHVVRFHSQVIQQVRSVHNKSEVS